MDKTTFWILDTISRSLNKSPSISELTRKIRQIHGTSNYADIYIKLQNLSEQGIIILTKTGKSSNISLNFEKYSIIDMLATIDLEKKIFLLEKKTELQMLIMEIETYCSQIRNIKSVSMIRPERNIKLNRVELLIILHNLEEAEQSKQILAIHELIKRIQIIHTINIDYLTLNTTEINNLLTSKERNPLKEMLSDKITFLHPQNFWITIKEMLDKGLKIQFKDEETNPTKITEQELIHNLVRLGYKEFGLETIQTESICIEYVITSILMKTKARRITAVPIILLKNKTNYNLLIFLSQKYKLSSKLLGLLKVLNKNRSIPEIKEAIKNLKTLNVKEIKANEESIMEKTKLYNA